MIHWKNACESDEVLKLAIGNLFKKNPEIINLFFNQTQPRLICSPEEIKEMARGFGSGDDLLIRIALDVWSEEGGIHFNEIYQKLDEHRFVEVINVLKFLREQK
jgi:hypothetical protein